MDETPCVVRFGYDARSGHFVGPADQLNSDPLLTTRQVLDVCESANDLDKYPKSALWGTISCIGIRAPPFPVFCIASPLVKGVKNDFLPGFVLKLYDAADGADVVIKCMTFDGEARWRAFAKNTLRKPNYPPEGETYIEIDHPDAVYFAPMAAGAGCGFSIVLSDAEHLLKGLRNQMLNNCLIVGNYPINMFFLEEIRTDSNFKGMVNLSVTDTNVLDRQKVAPAVRVTDISIERALFFQE